MNTKLEEIRTLNGGGCTTRVQLLSQALENTVRRARNRPPRLAPLPRAPLPPTRETGPSIIPLGPSAPDATARPLTKGDRRCILPLPPLHPPSVPPPGDCGRD